jgi:hypothetical protein
MCDPAAHDEENVMTPMRRPDPAARPWWLVIMLFAVLPCADDFVRGIHPQSGSGFRGGGQAPRNAFLFIFGLPLIAINAVGRG